MYSCCSLGISSWNCQCSHSRCGGLAYQVIKGKALSWHCLFVFTPIFYLCKFVFNCFWITINWIINFGGMQEYEKLKAAKMKESKNFFDHLLLSIFQSSITHYIKQFLQVLTCFIVTFCGQLCVLHLHLSFLTCGYYQVVFLTDFCSCHMILESSFKLTSDNHPDVL